MNAFGFLAAFCLVISGSEVADLAEKVEKLSKRLQLLEDRNDTTTKNREKKQIIFRGQPEIGHVSASSTHASGLYPLENLFDQDLSNFWHGTLGDGGDFLRLTFHKTETLKRIEVFRRFSAWAFANPVRYNLQFWLYRDAKLVNLKKTTDGRGNPFLQGAWNEFWNPI